MAGYREFQTGEVLTAANVDDFLAKQAVQKYADAAARDTALGTAVGGSNALREGMVAYLDDTDEVQYFDGSVWGPVGAEPPAGIGSNVVQTVKTDTFTTTSATFTDVTDLDVTITPSSNTAKVLVIAQYLISMSGEVAANHSRLLRGSTEIYLGDTAGSRIQDSAYMQGVAGTGGAQAVTAVSLVFLDSPAVNTAVTYKIQMRRGTALTAVLGRGGSDPDNADGGRVPSSITAIEVAA